MYGYVQEERLVEPLSNKGVNFFKMPKTRLSITFDDGERVEGEFLLSAFSNGKYYGGGFKAGAEAELDDGLLDVTLVKPCPRSVFLGLVAKYKNGTLSEDPRSKIYVYTKKCAFLKVDFLDERCGSNLSGVKTLCQLGTHLAGSTVNGLLAAENQVSNSQ